MNYFALHFPYRWSKKPLGNIREFFDWLKAGWQRAFRGYAKSDTWNIDSYLNSFMPPMLRNLKNNLHSYPHGITFEEWQGIVEDMALGFEAAGRIADNANWTANDGFDMRLVPTDNPNLKQAVFVNGWSEEQVKQFKELDKKDTTTFNKGMALFTQYYLNLWD